jgi:hypothetical protein
LHRKPFALCVENGTEKAAPGSSNVKTLGKVEMSKQPKTKRTPRHKLAMIHLGILF